MTVETPSGPDKPQSGNLALGDASTRLRNKALLLLPGANVIALAVLGGMFSLISESTDEPAALLFGLGSLAVSGTFIWYWWTLYHRRNAHFAWHDQLEPAILAWLQRRGASVADCAAIRSASALRERQIPNAVMVAWLVATILCGLLPLLWFIQMSVLFGRAGYAYAEDLLPGAFASPLMIATALAFVFAVLLDLYLVKHVLEDTSFHERRENVLLRLLSEKAQEYALDLDIPLERQRDIGWRSFWLQVLVFPLLTCTLYFLWTMYYLFQDGTSHAEHHLKWEDSILAALARDGITVGATAPSPALASVPPVSISQIMLWGAPNQQPDSVSAAIRQSAPAVAVPPAVAADAPTDRLRQLDRLRQDGLITQEEYDAKKRSILSDL